ncbi:hypothetical protein BD309DRAFT_1076165 [Dichomitus squalens]|nr:hypothetical protein BD309DRAFT_1076165 [Dichomitus squalens]
MRLFSLLGLFVGTLALLQNVVASPGESEADEPVVLAIAQFPETNAFGQVVNGERNALFVAIESKEADRNVTLKNIAGSLHNAQTDRLVKNLTKTDYPIPLIEGAPLQLPFAFHSEFKPGEYKLNIWIEHVVDGKTYRVTAYDSIITVVEPESSIFDFKLLLTYVIVTGLLGGLGYYTYLTLAPQPKKRKIPQPSAPVGTVTATGAGGYQEEWIPEHHLKKAKKPKASGAATSGDEASGVESGTEGRRRKAKK